MSFVARELDRISNRVRELQPHSGENSKAGIEYRELYAAQQALFWSLEPTGCMSPFDMICGSGAGCGGDGVGTSVGVGIGINNAYVVGLASKNNA